MFRSVLSPMASFAGVNLVIASPSLRPLTCLSAGLISCFLLALDAKAGVLDPNDFSSLGTLNLASGNITIDTDTLTISGAASFNGVASNQGGSADSFGGAAGPFGIPEIAVFAFDDINLTGTTNITVTGTRALALLSRSNVSIDVPLSVNGQGGASGVANVEAGGPGGFAGGLGSNNGVGPGGGGYSSSALSSGASGASGGFGSDGRDGLGFAVQGVGGSSYGYDLFGALQGGSGGGGASNAFGPSGGGGGGGALEVGALGFVNIGPNGVLEADGGAGDIVGGVGDPLFGGGGSGGAILVNAARLDNQGSINARGGDNNLGGQREGGGGRVFIPAPDTTVVAGEPVSISGLLTGIDVSPGAGSATLNQGVVTVLPELTIVPSGVTYNVKSFSPVMTQTATTTQPGVDVRAGNIQVTGTGELAVPSGHGLYINSYSIELRSSAASITGGLLVNADELRGTGTVDAAVVNDAGGQINATNDQLTFTKGVDNDAGGQVNAVNSTLSFPGDGVPSSLGGDNFDGLNNYGDLTLVGTTVNGDVHSPAGSNIYVGGTGVVFNGLVSGGANFPGIGAVTLNGGYAPGDSPAQVDLGGDVILGNDNTLFVELGGTTPGSFDQLLIAGDVQLAGSLDVELLAPFSLSPGQQFAIIDTDGALNGAFNGLGEGDLVGNFDGVDLFISYQNGVTLLTVPEPATWVLWGTAAFVLGIVARRRRLPTRHEEISR